MLSIVQGLLLVGELAGCLLAALGELLLRDGHHVHRDSVGWGGRGRLGEGVAESQSRDTGSF
jgi:hypothetical protein